MYTSNLFEVARIEPRTTSSGKKVRMEEKAEALAIANASCSNARHTESLSRAPKRMNGRINLRQILRNGDQKVFRSIP
ncbi:MAG: hypothetical protein DMG93_09340 [Acidobacteria bacterium]|nr:MAG: hypothetical protein DMG93_09340 [Acidobacteriota bacterium]